MAVRKGDRGDEVRRLQQALNAAGFGPLALDGDFGPMTHARVLAFQRDRGLDPDGIVGPLTWEALDFRAPAPEVVIGAYSADAVIATMANLGYPTKDDGQMNIVGVRSSETRANEFDDVMYFIWREGDEWLHKAFRVTTDPGTFWLENPMRAEGAAIVVEGHYPGAYTWGSHRGQYETLVQRGGRIKVYRDANRDQIIDTDESTIMEGFFGCNIHKAGADSERVHKWSAGCQVFAREADWRYAMALCRSTEAESFDYTLLLESDFGVIVS